MKSAEYKRKIVKKIVNTKKRNFCEKNFRNSKRKLKKKKCAKIELFVIFFYKLS